MSYFVVNSLTINKDFTKFKAKGGDNNLIPRSNSWSDWIDIERLLDCITSGNMQFGHTNREQFLMLDALANKFRKEWSGEWEKETDMYHSFRKDEVPIELISLNKEFIRQLKIEMKEVNKKPYYIHIRYGYVSHINWRYVGRSEIHYGSHHSAKRFGKYQAERIRKNWSNVNAEIVTKLKEN